MSGVAAVFACLYLSVPPTMLWIHFVHRWRGGLSRHIFVVHGAVYAGIVLAVALLHSVWPLGAWPFPPGVRVMGALLIVAALALLALSYRDINSWTAMAGPQVTGGTDRALITTGVFGVIRHPRYAVLILGALGNFLLTGYPLLFVAFVVTTALTLLVIAIEERELVAFFGESYRRYRRQVPALFPGFRRRGDTVNS